jgi:cell division protein FtsL
MSTLMDQARNRFPRIAEAAVERARLTVVPRTASRRTATMPFMALVSVLLIGGVAGLLYFNTSMQQVSFTATALEDKAERLDAHRQGLQMELDDLRNPQRVALEAKKLGMVPPAGPAFIRLGDGRVLGTPTPATAGDSLRITPLPTRKPKDLNPKPLVITTAKHPTTAAADGAAPGADTPQTGTKKTGTRKTGTKKTGTKKAQNSQQGGSPR